MAKRRKVYGTIRVPGYPDAQVTSEAVAVYIEAMQREVARLRTELEAATQDRRQPLVIVPGRAN